MREHFYVTPGISAEALQSLADRLRRETRYPPRESTIHHHSYNDPCTGRKHNEYELLEDDK